MKSAARKFLIALVFLAGFLPLSANSQNLTGIWRGYFITDAGEQYKYELQIEQTKTNRISGVSYSYLDTRFYGKATLTGNFTKTSKAALVQEIKTVEVKMSAGSVACIMKCFFTYSRSGNESFLEGSYTSVFEEGLNKGGNCGGGKVFLRKVPTSDFYIEPFLRKPVQEKPPPPVQKPVQKPQASQTRPATTTPRKPTVTRPSSPIKPGTDSVKRNVPQIINEKPTVKSVVKIPPNTRSRQNELVQTLIVTNQEINVRLYDNGEIDGDTISVYLDGKPIVTNKGLSTTPISVTVKLDESNPEHTLVMVAENLGSIPPNTSLMIVQDGDERHQVSITSTEQKNAMVRFRYQKK